jgi:(E)-4-hydroxy-3-methylbut-2-enyl-diphosphate synthase
MKVAVMGCVVNGPGEAEGADVAVFAGDRKGIIYVQGERVATVPEDEILDRLLVKSARQFQEKVRSARPSSARRRSTSCRRIPRASSAAAGRRWPPSARQVWADVESTRPDPEVSDCKPLGG